ncbi:lytic transglycosylase domain-containing protein [Aquabacterium lacunae]|uniref:Lytic transglycosylase domain-containing protein n=1 Tax=Aquabacterium lacunae TaxID=2528630 RepID=A0A4Q9GZ69_9BURK|nr:lytic transglycosylase domain-containing protein [Aquabacterium lacunae]TBO28276.1 lytic transglycosylase domain-containing protein [Aquabacterium lacunae]
MRLWTFAKGRRPVLASVVMACALVVGASGLGLGASTAQAAEYSISDAREAWRLRDRARLLAARDALIAERHPLAPWADYWWASLRIVEMGPAEADEFMARWGDAYVADRFRNDWLLELGRRKDWRNFLRVQPAFRMADDREVLCLGLLARQQLGLPMEGPNDLREQARQAWLAQRDADNGCDTMAQALLAANVLQPSDVWRKLWQSMDNAMPKAISQTSRLLGEPTQQAIARLMGAPQAFLTQDQAVVPPGGAHAPGATVEPTPTKGAKASAKAQRQKNAKAGKGKQAPSRALVPPPPPVPTAHAGPVNLLALQRWAQLDPVAAAAALGQDGAARRWQLDREQQVWAWASVGRVAAGRLMPEAVRHFDRAMVMAELNEAPMPFARAWAPDTLAWAVRTGVRASTSGQSSAWPLVDFAYESMSAEQKADPAWMYWKARSLLAQSAGASVADPRRMAGREMLSRVASPHHFYGLLAAEDLNGQPLKAPSRLARPGPDEMDAARQHPGLDRALRLYEQGWRSEGAREWNYALNFQKPGGMNDRELIAAAELACSLDIWDRCINTSERTRSEFDVVTRFPLPFRREIVAAARDVGLDAAYMFGLIRQESRFQITVRSHVGAAGLMQVMPATAQWTARKLGMNDYTPDMITDRDTNLRLGAGYLKLVMDDLDGSQAMAAAAYNAGPGRPRKWREGARLETAAWAENVPFNETRDYVKKVLYNAVMYGHVLHGKSLSIKNRLGSGVGPKAPGGVPDNTELP